MVSSDTRPGSLRSTGASQLADPDVWDDAWRGQRAALGTVSTQPFAEWFELNWEISNRYWAEFLARHAAGRRLLECGGATGRLPVHLARQGWHCTMVDLTTEGPLLARERFRRARHRGWFATGNVYHLPFADETFDVVYSSGLLDVVPDITAATREMTRVLRPGGLFVAATNPRRRSIQSAAEGLLSLERQVRQRLVRPAASQGHRPTSAARPHIRNAYSLEAHLVACRAAGLRQVRGHGVGLLPVVGLPDPYMRRYLQLTRLLLPLCLSFDRCEAAWTAQWGVLLAIYGFK